MWTGRPESGAQGEGVQMQRRGHRPVIGGRGHWRRIRTKGGCRGMPPRRGSKPALRGILPYFPGCETLSPMPLQLALLVYAFVAAGSHCAGAVQLKAINVGWRLRSGGKANTETAALSRFRRG